VAIYNILGIINTINSHETLNQCLSAIHNNFIVLLFIANIVAQLTEGNGFQLS